ncbi:hypothetical protein SESBI_40517 [Sesbania bispinosa]|nr:hypothetical protein SESBI_40517 [Sesbania bispinosa]
MDADCFTSLLRRRTTALTPATVSTKFVNPINPNIRFRIQLARHNGGFLLRGVEEEDDDMGCPSPLDPFAGPIVF